MRHGKLLTATMVAALVLGLFSGVQAKPGKGNKHGHPENHGKYVSKWARLKPRGYEKAKHNGIGTRWDRDRDYVAAAPHRSPYWRDSYRRSEYRRSTYQRPRTAQRGYQPTRYTGTQRRSLRRARIQMREQQLRQARRNRRSTVQEARRSFRQTRKSIVRDGDGRKRLTAQQKQRLREARRARNSTVRATRRNFKQTRRQSR
jgi:hypothetical protein